MAVLALQVQFQVQLLLMRGVEVVVLLMVLTVEH
jgi:hypothetical protein